MKRTISVMACLAIVATSPLVAIDVDTTMSTNDHILFSDVESSTPAKKPAKEKALIYKIPDAKLLLEADLINEVLKVSLDGVVSDNLEWVIFQPKGETISRISTNSMINQIKIDNLAVGEYVLMIKDSEGRALFQSFSKA